MRFDGPDDLGVLGGESELEGLFSSLDIQEKPIFVYPAVVP